MSAAQPSVPASAPVPEGGGASVDADNPWLGLASFTEETRGYFFGREGEVTELARRVQRKLLTVLFGKSGLGKTSILRAGLVPRLRAQGYFPVYLRLDYGHDSPEAAEQIKLAIRQAAAAGQWTQTGVAVAGESIWEFLHHRGDVLKDASGATLTPLLIFDQFEELFTLAQSDEFGRTRAVRFIEELADLVENRPPKALEAKLDTDESITERFDFARSDYRVVIALREDYLAPLESLKKVMPSLAQNRLRLAPMTGSQALQAVLQPGNRFGDGRPLVSEEVAEAIVRFVAGGSELANAEVEPSLLSLICRELNEQRIAQHRAEISQDLLAGSHDTILSSFYERSLADQPASVRRIIEDDLLTESGYRENLAEESLLRRFQAAGAAPDALGKLVNRRLLRIEERLDVRRVELTHDVLTGVVKASRDARHEREAREATERLLAEQRERESAARRALRRARAVAAGCTVLALLAIAATAAAVFSMQRARRAEQVARQTRGVSEQARQQADGLLGFLTDDLVRELETFGREQTIAELSQQEIDYFQRLPAQLKDPQTVRSAALALADHANALRTLGDPAAGAENATEAIALLQPLRGHGDHADSTTLVLGRAYRALGEIGSVTNNSAEATGGARAEALLGPIAERAGAPVEARRAYEEALATEASDDELILHRPQETARAAQKAMRIAAQLGAGRGVDVTLDADYAYAEGWLAAELVNFGTDEEAHRVGEEAVTVADRVVMQRPQYARALQGKFLGEIALQAAADNELDPAAGMQFGMQSTQTTLALVGIEPQNALYVNNLATAYSQLFLAAWDAGQLREATLDGRKAIETWGRVSAGGAMFLVFIADNTSATANSLAELGDPAAGAATLAAGEAFLSQALGASHGDRSAGALMSTVRADVTAESAYERGDFSAARRIAHDALIQSQNERAGAALPTPVTNPVMIPLYVRLDFSDVEGRADYQLGDFPAAEQAERTALKALAAVGSSVGDQRERAGFTTWLSMALAREGKRQEAARTIGPLVTLYRALDAKNRSVRWLPLEYAEALYAQALSDPPQRAALLAEAAQQMNHLIPAIAQLHDTREWRAMIEAAQRVDR